MVETVVIAIVLIIGIVLGLLISRRHKMPSNEDLKVEQIDDETNLKDALPEGVDLFGDSSLIEYLPTQRFEDATISVVTQLLKRGKSIFLVTEAPRTRIYYKKFEKPIKNKILTLINLTSENPLSRPQMFKVSFPNSADANKKSSDISNVSVNSLEYLMEITEHMDEGSILVFEALSELILALGVEKREAVYRFFSSIVEEMSTKNRSLVSFMNRGAHGKETVSAYEGFFLKIFSVDKGKITTVK